MFVHKPLPSSDFLLIQAAQLLRNFGDQDACMLQHFAASADLPEKRLIRHREVGIVLHQVEHLALERGNMVPMQRGTGLKVPHTK